MEAKNDQTKLKNHNLNHFFSMSPKVLILSVLVGHFYDAATRLDLLPSSNQIIVPTEDFK